MGYVKKIILFNRNCYSYSVQNAYRSLSAVFVVVKYPRSHMNKEILVLSACNSSFCCSRRGEFCGIPTVLFRFHLTDPLHQSYDIRILVDKL